MTESVCNTDNVEVSVEIRPIALFSKLKFAADIVPMISRLQDSPPHSKILGLGCALPARPLRGKRDVSMLAPQRPAADATPKRERKKKRQLPRPPPFEFPALGHDGITAPPDS